MDLKPYEILCPRCDGNGIINETKNTLISSSTCHKCRGYKIIDWIENISGVKRDYLYNGIYIHNSKSDGIYIRNSNEQYGIVIKDVASNWTVK